MILILSRTGQAARRQCFATIVTYLLAILGGPSTANAVDVAIVNANVITVDDAKPRAEAFAIVGERFTKVGSNEEIERIADEATKVIDLRGLTVVPGFNDAHIHPQPIHRPMSRLGNVPCDPAHVRSMDELVAALKAKAEVTPKGQWVIGARYQDTKLGGHPTRNDLDEASTDHPIYIGHSSGHIGVVNTLALKLANVDENTSDPRGGAFDRDDSNFPTGVLRESARARVRDAGPELPVATTQETIDGYRRQFEAYSEKGITSIQIAGIDLDTVKKLQAMPQEARPLRIYVMLRNEHLGDLIELKRQNALGDDYFRLGAIKRWFGNSLSGRTCWLHEAYAARPDYFGIPPRDTQREINERVQEIHNAGLQACIHANGDREIDMLLDAYQAALRANPRADHRHRIEHCSVVNEKILQRIKHLGIVLATHSYVYEHGDKMEAYGKDRWNMMHPNRSAIELGIPVAGNSDGPVSEPHPMLRIQSMVTRESAEGKVYGEMQRVTVNQAIRVWTLGSAYASFEEDIKGSITEGKLADFVVLDRDPREIDSDKLQSVVVENTFVGGKLVYERRPIEPIGDSSGSGQVKSIIDFRNRQSIADHRPIIVAHRGGVVGPSSPECSLTSIQLAAQQGYDMVELDIQISNDGVPIVFHDRTLREACARNGRIEDYNAEELASIQYSAGHDQIARLDTALRLCRQLNLGVMMDLKAGRDSVEFLEEIARLLEKRQLVNSTITISGSKAARRVLKGIRFTPTEEEMNRLRSGQNVDLSHRFWFGLPRQLQPGDIEKLKASGSLIIPAINTFRYPASRHLELARGDIQRLTKKGVDGFQIDSVYSSMINRGN